MRFVFHLLQKNIFLVLLFATILIAGFVPYQEKYNHYFDINAFIKWGIFGIFLLYGLKLNLNQILDGLKNWRLHLLVQLATFCLFPLLVFPFYFLFKDSIYENVWLSVFFLSVLPSTVSSSVVMVAIAKGNVPAAIFNASISGLIGIVVTPLLLGFFISKGNVDLSFGDILVELLTMVLLPIILGLLFNKVLKKTVTKYSSKIALFDKFIILVIVYESFSSAFLNQIFKEYPVSVFLVIFLSVVLLFFTVYQLLFKIATRINFNIEDKITTVFCGSKKSLVHGSMFVMILGLSEDQQVLFLVPILLYHSFQLFYVSYLADKFAASKT